jgi:hypothetical protein
MIMLKIPFLLTSEVYINALNLTVDAEDDVSKKNAVLMI